MTELTIENAELVSVREASRHLGQMIDRLARGDVRKVVVMNRTRMAAVIIMPDEYARLAKGRK